MTTDEVPARRRVNDAEVAPSSALMPTGAVLAGHVVRLEPIDPDRHTGALYHTGHTTELARRSWEFLPWGPFPSEAALYAWVSEAGAKADRVAYAICDRSTGEAVGMATYLDIQPSSGVIEIGGIWFAPGFARSRGATEALFLMLSHAMGDLRYRRMQWRCNALNEKSRTAARRLGFRFEGIWFNHMIVKGRNRDTAWYSILDTEWPAIRTSIMAWLDPENFDTVGQQRRSLSKTTAAVTTCTSV